MNRSLLLGHTIENPPSMTRFCPVIQLLSSLARYTAALPISPRLDRAGPSGCCNSRRARVAAGSASRDEDLLGEFGEHEARADRIHANPMLRKIECHGPRHAEHAGFGGAIGDAFLHRNGTDDRSDEDDGSRCGAN